MNKIKGDTLINFYQKIKDKTKHLVHLSDHVKGLNVTKPNFRKIIWVIKKHHIVMKEIDGKSFLKHFCWEKQNHTNSKNIAAVKIKDTKKIFKVLDKVEVKNLTSYKGNKIFMAKVIKIVFMSVI